MKKATQILNLPVMGIKEGAQKGVVKDFIVDTQTKAVEYLLVQEGRRFNPFLIAMSDVTGVGENYVIVKSTDDLKKVYDDKDKMDKAGNGFYLLDATVLSDEGNLMGKVCDFETDLATGVVGKVFLEDGTSYENGQIVALSNDFVFVGETGVAEEVAAVPEPEPAVDSVAAESRSFLIGQTVRDDVLSDDGLFKVAAGTVLTEEMVALAEQHDAVPLLIVNID